MAATTLSEAIGDLADLFEFGALEASTNPIFFIEHVTSEIKALRLKLDALEQQDDYCKNLLAENIDLTDETTELRDVLMRVLGLTNQLSATLSVLRNEG